MSQAIFGQGTKTHFEGDGWVLEAPAADRLRLRTTSANFQNFGMVGPTNCGGGGAGGTATMDSVHRFSFGVGDTIEHTFCTEGSMIFVTISSTAGDTPVGYFRCWRFAGNANACQRILPE
jgi:hypothetical protein